MDVTCKDWRVYKHLIPDVRLMKKEEVVHAQ